MAEEPTERVEASATGSEPHILQLNHGCRPKPRLRRTPRCHRYDDRSSPRFGYPANLAAVGAQLP